MLAGRLVLAPHTGDQLSLVAALNHKSVKRVRHRLVKAPLHLDAVKCLQFIRSAIQSLGRSKRDLAHGQARQLGVDLLAVGFKLELEHVGPL